jgi:hypothetical protein
MGVGISLVEEDLRAMPQDLRENLLKWYFARDAVRASETGPALVPVSVRPVSITPRREETGRISFPEFVRAGLLVSGTQVVCRALKRQKRGGGEPYIDAGVVLPDGGVEYRGRRFEVPSKLAVQVVNDHGGNTQALNGYDYLFTRIANKLVPLSELRDRFLKESA